MVTAGLVWNIMEIKSLGPWRMINGEEGGNGSYIYL